VEPNVRRQKVVLLRRLGAIIPDGGRRQHHDDWYRGVRGEVAVHPKGVGP
jgi:hypothetical protein